MGSDHQSSGGPAPRADLQPGETAELLGAVDEQNVLDSEAPKELLPLRRGQLSVPFVKNDRPGSQPALFQSPSELLQQGRLPAAMEPHQGGAETEDGEAAQ